MYSRLAVRERRTLPVNCVIYATKLLLFRTVFSIVPDLRMIGSLLMSTPGQRRGGEVPPGTTEDAPPEIDRR